MKYAITLTAVLLFWTLLYGIFAYPLMVPPSPLLGMLQWIFGAMACVAVWLTIVVTTDW